MKRLFHNVEQKDVSCIVKVMVDSTLNLLNTDGGICDPTLFLLLDLFLRQWEFDLLFCRCSNTCLH